MFKKKSEKKPEPLSNMNTMENADHIVTDPFGMYTGIPADPYEQPVQDSDDI